MRTVVCVFLFLLLVGPARPARAITFHDAPAFTQRVAQVLQFLLQTRQVINGVRDNLSAFRQAYEGLKDWRNMGWVDTLRLLESPWFDKVEGIDQIRQAATATVMTAEQAHGLWADIDGLSRWEQSRRYRTDPWYRRKVDSLRRQSQRARAQRSAFVRQMQAQNRQLIEDVAKTKRIHEAIKEENRRTPVNHGKIASLQAELAALQTRSHGEQIMLTNQRAIMFLVGEDDAQRVYVETMESDWLDGNSQAMKKFGRGFAR